MSDNNANNGGTKSTFEQRGSNVPTQPTVPKMPKTSSNTMKK